MAFVLDRLLILLVIETFFLPFTGRLGCCCKHPTYPKLTVYPFLQWLSIQLMPYRVWPRQGRLFGAACLTILFGKGKQRDWTK